MSSKKDSRDRRQEILDAACEIFAERGIDNTTVRDIGEAAGILSGSLYYHFSSKDEMVREILDKHSLALTTALDAPSAIEDPLEALRACIRTGVKLVAERPSIFRIFLNEAGYIRSTAALEAIERRKEGDRARWVRLVQRAIAAGAVRPDVNAEIVVELTWQGLVGSIQWLPPTGSMSANDVADQLVGLYLDGLRSR